MHINAREIFKIKGYYIFLFKINNLAFNCYHC